MNLSALSVRRGVTAVMFYLMILGFGLFGLRSLQLDLYPDISFPVVVVITNYLGASPEDIETVITRPIESAAATVKNVEKITSDSKNGVSVVMINFDWGKDMAQAETDVRRALEMITGYLPADAEKPLVFAFDPSMQPIVMFMITGPYPLDQLRQLALDEIQPRIERLPGVAASEVAGGLEREIHVLLDPAKIEAFGLDVAAVQGAIWMENLQEPGGALEQGSIDFTIKTIGKYQSVAEIGEILVGMKVGPTGKPEPLRLKEVARVEDAFYESQRVLEVDHEPAVWMFVRKQSGANTVRASEAVVNAFPEIKRAAAADIEFKVIFNQAEFINQAIGNLSTSAMAGVAITFLVLLFFLRSFVAALIVAAAIPVSVIATFFVMRQADMTLNVISMAGLALAVGMLVDNAIVTLENIFRLRQEGRHPWEAAIQGAGTVGLAITASTLTTVAVFVPVLFVPGIAGVLFKDMAITICFALGLSLLVAFTFVPLAASRLLGRQAAASAQDVQDAHDPLRRLREWYGRSLDWVLAHRWSAVLAVLGLLLVTGVLSAFLPMDFMRQDDNSILFVSVETPVGSSLEEAYRGHKEVEAVLERVVTPEERKLIGLDVGIGKGFVALFSKGVHAGLFRVPLVPVSQRQRSQKEIEDAVRAATRSLPGIKVSVGQVFNLMGGQGDIEVQILGHDLEVSRRIGLELRDTLLTWPEISEASYSLEDQKPELQVRFDRSKLAELGISSASATKAISAYFQGKLAGRYAEGGEEFDIIVRYDRQFRLDTEALRRMPVVSRTGQPVPLGNIAALTVGLGPTDITRLDQGRLTRIFVTLGQTWTDPDGGTHRKDLGSAIAKLEKTLAAYPWPKGFSYDIGGTAEDFQESFGYLGLALLISVLLVYMVMASQFESFRQPFIIMFTVPLAFIGVVLMFVVTRSTVDVAAAIGAIILVGIVVNNGIVLVDFANQLRLEGLDRGQAAARAARLRLRPVLMTALTTIGGMTPMALEIGEGSAGWGGMAKAVIGGLAVASFLTLFIIPVMYTVFAQKTIRQELLEQRRAAIEAQQAAVASSLR